MSWFISKKGFALLADDVAKATHFVFRLSCIAGNICSKAKFDAPNIPQRKALPMKLILFAS
jgi:hypothetical protein